jgi:hypothetical protein
MSEEDSRILSQIRELAQYPEYQQAINEIDKGLKQMPASYPPQPHMNEEDFAKNFQAALKKVYKGDSSKSTVGTSEPTSTVTLEEAIAEANSFSVTITINEE